MAHRIVFFGHSHVRRLGEYVERHENLSNFELPTTQVVTSFVGRGGLKRKNVLDPAIISDLRSHSPQTLVMMFGDNDIKKDSSPQEISLMIFSVISAIRARVPSIDKVVLVQLLPRYLTRNSWYNKVAERTNLELSYLARHRSYVRFFLCSFWFPGGRYPRRYSADALLFGPDGVHLNEQGNEKLYDKLKSVVISSSRH